MNASHKLPHYATSNWWRWMHQAIGCGVVTSVANLLVLDGCIFLPLASLLGWLWAWRVLHGLSRAQALAAHELVKTRTFPLTRETVPTPPASSPRHWQPQWVPYLMIAESTEAHPSATRTWRKQLRACDRWRVVLHEQRQWLCRYALPRWQVVTRWWMRWYVEPEQQRLRALSPRSHDSRSDESCWSQAREHRSVELLCGIAIAGDSRLWCSRIGFGDESDAYLELARSLTQLADDGLSAPAALSATPPFPRHSMPCSDQLYIGHGFRWECQHTQGLDDLKLQPPSDGAAEHGDPRIFGIGASHQQPCFMDEAQFNHMTAIFGATGVGKTRFAEILLIQVIRSGLPLIIIDPKGDQTLTNRVLEECRLAGRGHQFRYFTLAAPTRERTWRYLSRYNPCATYTDPAELAARISSVLPATRDPFWTNVAKAMVETCLTLCHWLNWYLRVLARDADGHLAAADSREVPSLLLALQWARHYPDATPREARAAVEHIRRHWRNPGFTAPDPATREVLALLTTTAPSGELLYSPVEWLPTVRHVNDYEIDQTVAFLGWVLKIVFFHCYLDGERFAQADFPRTASVTELVSKLPHESDDSAWSRYLSSDPHPLERRVQQDAPITQRERRTIDFFDHFLIAREGDSYEWTRLFTQLRRNLDSHYSDCTKERQKFLEYATTLQSALKPFLGERSRIMCSPVCDIVWHEVVSQQQVVYCGLASMIDDHGATACAKMIVHDLSSYFGRRYQYHAGAAAPIYLFADEVGSFINEPFIHLLNKCRGVGLRAIIAGQTRADLAKHLGKEGASQALANLNHVFQLRSPLMEDARDFSAAAGEAKIISESRQTSLTPQHARMSAALSGAFTVNESHGYSASRVTRVPQEAIMSLPRGQAFLHSQGQVYLLAQGLLPPLVTDLFAEIGMHPGTMRSAVSPGAVVLPRPSPEPSGSATTPTPQQRIPRDPTRSPEHSDSANGDPDEIPC